uniref:Methylosome subunit pICln n=1 Tax=Canis lupus familiaris TaxID=9615 RepID=A0A8C0Q9E3_CANLF
MLHITHPQGTTIVRSHLSSVRKASMKNTRNKCWRGRGENRNPHALLVGMQMGAATLENSMECPQNIKSGGNRGRARRVAGVAALQLPPGLCLRTPCCNELPQKFPAARLGRGASAAAARDPGCAERQGPWHRHALHRREPPVLVRWLWIRILTGIPTISLHAVSRDLNAYPREHLYVMVNAKFGEESKESAAEEEEDSDDDVEPIAEFRFVPSDKSALEAMFTVMCECQAWHPDPEDEDSDDYDGDVEAHAEGQAILERLEGMLSQSVSSQYNMAGVRTEDSIRDYEDGMEVDTTPTIAGQFEDADVDH